FGVRVAIWGLELGYGAWLVFDRPGVLTSRGNTRGGMVLCWLTSILKLVRLESCSRGVLQQFVVLSCCSLGLILWEWRCYPWRVLSLVGCCDSSWFETILRDVRLVVGLLGFEARVEELQVVVLEGVQDHSRRNEIKLFDL
ncbi:hypothetical protein Droror1_Dr00027951, partial [Drosera rotundifolia]